MGEKTSLPPRVGFITYDLQEFTADCLSRIQKALKTPVKGYPVMERIASERVEFAFRPSKMKGRFFVVRKPGNTPESFAYSINWGAAWACVRENQVVVLFGLQGGTALLGALLARLFRRPLVSVNQTLPPEWELKRRWWVRRLKSLILSCCHIHVVQTPVTRNTLVQVYKINPETLVEAPFESGATVFKQLFMNVNESREQLRRKFGWRESECVFLFVGTLLRFKGVETVLDAVSLLRRHDKAFRVLFIGPEATQVGEPSIREYEARAVELEVGHRISFTGKRSLAELAFAYLAADVLLLPTHKDTWGKVLVEAALAGLPFVTTSACGAAGSLVEDGRTGLVIPPEDPTALAKSMQRLLDPALRRRLGDQARNFVLDFCDPDKEALGYSTAILAAANAAGSANN